MATNVESVATYLYFYLCINRCSKCNYYNQEQHKNRRKYDDTVDDPAYVATEEEENANE